MGQSEVSTINQERKFDRESYREAV